MTVQQILAKHYQPAGVMGDASTSLESDLQAHARLNAIIYTALFAVLLVILGVVGTMLIHDAQEGHNARTSVLAGAGLSVPIVVEMIRRTVREWSQASLMALLAKRLEGPQLQAVIEKLIDKT